MDFFEHQELARKKTRLLVVYFILAVLGIIASIYAVVVGASFFMSSEGAASFNWWQPEVLLYAALGSSGVIALGTGFKTLQLSAGGSVVAMELGGRRIDRNTSDFEERRLLNVVEEMAIASGVPVPDVYIMDNEMGINAFAAGKTTSDAVIGVTRGTVRLLNRDELQGVMAHEFSHILNGDMRLNMRLIGLLFGILFIAMIGQIVMRSVMFVPRSRNRDSNGGGVLAILAFGAALIAIGYVGLFFAKLIKAAISRQREFLADASAVQFTRNPEGIAGALKKIGGLSQGSTIASPRAEAASHMFFGDAFQDGVMQMQSFATHPPLGIRIQKIEPGWDGVFSDVKLPDISQSQEVGESRAGSAGLVSGLSSTEAVSRARGALKVGEPGAEQLAYGYDLVNVLSPASLSAIRGGAGGQAIVFALLLGQDDQLRQSEITFLEQSVDQLTLQNTLGFYAEIGSLDSSKKIALIDLTIPSLRQLSPPEYERFQSLTQSLVESDGQIDLFEFMLQKIIRRHLDLFFNRVRPPKIRYRHLAKLRKELSILLSTLAGVGSRSEGQAKLAFQEGEESVTEELGGERLRFLPPEECDLGPIGASLDRFDEATPLMKKRLLHACGKVVMADQKINDSEAELLRAIADTIGCPIPPFVKAS